MEDLQKGDVLLCPDCGFALAQATATIPPGAMNWTNTLRPLSPAKMPLPGTPAHDILCPRCSAHWYPNFAIARKV